MMSRRQPASRGSVTPIYVKQEQMPGHCTVFEVCVACESVTGEKTIRGATIVNRLWRILPFNETAKATLLADGVYIKGKKVTFSSVNPYAKGDSGETKITKLTVEGLPWSYGQDAVAKNLRAAGYVLRGEMKWAVTRDDNKHLSDFEDGLRMVYIDVPETKKENVIMMGGFKTFIKYHEQYMFATCYNCFQIGHTKKHCPNPEVCAACKQPGHRKNDPLCPLFMGGQPPRSYADATNGGFRGSQVLLSDTEVHEADDYASFPPPPPPLLPPPPPPPPEFSLSNEGDLSFSSLPPPPPPPSSVGFQDVNSAGNGELPAASGGAAGSGIACAGSGDAARGDIAGASDIGSGGVPYEFSGGSVGGRGGSARGRCGVSRSSRAGTNRLKDGVTLDSCGDIPYAFGSMKDSGAMSFSFGGDSLVSGGEPSTLRGDAVPLGRGGVPSVGGGAPLPVRPGFPLPVGSVRSTPVVDGFNPWAGVDTSTIGGGESRPAGRGDSLPVGKGMLPPVIDSTVLPVVEGASHPVVKVPLPITVQDGAESVSAEHSSGCDQDPNLSIFGDNLDFITIGKKGKPLRRSQRKTANKKNDKPHNDINDDRAIPTQSISKKSGGIFPMFVSLKRNISQALSPEGKGSKEPTAKKGS